MRNINILSDLEIKKFEKPPKFSYQEKEYYFQTPGKLLENIIYKDNKIIMMLMWGYFKATNKFFLIEKKDENLKYLMNKYNVTSIEFPINTKTLYRYKSQIKEYLGINNYSFDIKNRLQEQANNLAINLIHRKKIFYSLLELSIKLKIEIPSYTELSRIITMAINSQKKVILKRFEKFIDDKKLKVLNEFSKKDKNYKNRYILMNYKKLEHSTKKREIVKSLEKFKTIKSKFHILEKIINSIGLTPETAEYYAKWIEKSQIFQLTRKQKIESNFLLLLFIYYQYFIRNDNLIDRFISIVQTTKNSLLRVQKENSFEKEPYKNKLINSLEDINISTLNEIEKVIKDPKLSAIKKVREIKLLVERKTEILKDILQIKQQNNLNENNKYEFLETKSISLQGKLSEILRNIEFDENSSDKNIIEAINYFKNHSTLTNKAPNKFLDDEDKQIIYTTDKFRVSLYKALLFIYVSDSIKKGTLNLKYSFRYKNFEDYLIDKTEWIENKTQLLKIHELDNLRDFNSFIEIIKQKLENSFKNTNNNILKGLNNYFISNNTSFILKTPKIEKIEDSSISKYFPKNENISIIDILYSINLETDFLSSFKHYAQSKTKINKNILLATILGYGCNLSLSKMGKISKGINENQLDNTKIWYFSKENTEEANNKIIEFMEKLPIVKLMKNDININHTSSDGQKYNISVDSTNAGYSFKYFGTNKGVVAYTFIDESHRLFHSKIINVNERESGYVIDGLLSNNTIKSDIHSTDTHGFSEVIFGVTNLLGFSFAPRIKNFKDQQLYGFYNPKYYYNLGYTLIPKRKIKLDVIKNNWDDILRFIITIKERKTTATQLLKRLTSYSKQHKLYTALKEFGKIIKTDFLLNYIDDLEFRQRIEKQLNKIEASNKFSKAVFFGNNSEFSVATVEEQNIANNSKRLIQNAIILWNYLFISKKLNTAKTQTEKDEILFALKNSSIIH